MIHSSLPTGHLPAFLLRLPQAFHDRHPLAKQLFVPSGFVCISRWHCGQVTSTEHSSRYLGLGNTLGQNVFVYDPRLKSSLFQVFLPRHPVPSTNLRNQTRVRHSSWRRHIGLEFNELLENKGRPINNRVQLHERIKQLPIFERGVVFDALRV